MFPPAIEARFSALTDRYPDKRSALIPMLLLVQQEVGWIKPEAIEYVARYLDLSPSDVESVVSFYTLLHRQPVGKNLILVCTNISCMLCGSDDVEEELREQLKIGWGETTSDGLFTLVEAECLGSCTTAPVMQVNGTFHENLTRQEVQALISQLRAQFPEKEHERDPASPES